MKLKPYDHLLGVNQGFDQVPRSLKALAKYPALRPEELALTGPDPSIAAGSSLSIPGLSRLEAPE